MVIKCNENIKEITRIERENRTNRQLMYAWDVLLKNPIKYIPKSEKVINDKLDYLRYTSKSRLGSFNFCQMVFRYSYILDISVPNMSFYMTMGRNMHWVMEVLYDTLDVDELVRCDNIKKYIIKKIYNLIPQKITNDRVGRYIISLIKNIARYEDYKIMRIERMTGGRSKENIKRYFFPSTTELGIENAYTYKDGFIDAEYYIPDPHGKSDKYCVVDYKFGNPKFYLNNKWDKKNIKFEMAFYKALREEPGAKYITKEKRLKILPYKDVDYGMMVFFQSPKKTAKLFKLKDEDVRDVNEELEKYWLSLDKGKFKCKWKAMDYCMDRCPYFWKYCYEYEDKWNRLRMKNK